MFSLENWKAVDVLFKKTREHYTLKGKYHKLSNFSLIPHSARRKHRNKLKQGREKSERETCWGRGPATSRQAQTHRAWRGAWHQGDGVAGQGKVGTKSRDEQSGEKVWKPLWQHLDCPGSGGGRKLEGSLLTTKNNEKVIEIFTSSLEQSAVERAHSQHSTVS